MRLSAGTPFMFASAIKSRGRGKVVCLAGQAVWEALRPTDPVGTIVCTFQGVVAGSEIRVFDSTDTEIAGVETCTANHVLTWDAYTPGSSGNNVRVKVVNLAYKIKDFPFVVSAGVQSLPIQQELDPWYSNP